MPRRPLLEHEQDRYEHGCCAFFEFGHSRDGCRLDLSCLDEKLVLARTLCSAEEEILLMRVWRPPFLTVDDVFFRLFGAAAAARRRLLQGGVVRAPIPADSVVVAAAVALAAASALFFFVRLFFFFFFFWFHNLVAPEAAEAEALMEAEAVACTGSLDGEEVEDSEEGFLTYPSRRDFPDILEVLDASRGCSCWRET